MTEQHKYNPSCPCAACEKHRAKNGMTMLNPREARGEAPEVRPASEATEVR